MNLNVPIERVIHDSLKQMLQNISDQYGIQVRSINIDWTDTSTYSQSRFIINQLEETSFSK